MWVNNITKVKNFTKKVNNISSSFYADVRPEKHLPRPSPPTALPASALAPLKMFSRV